jgi:hypothetical protein
MSQIKLELTLLDEPRSPFVVVAGGLDADRDGTVEDDDEVQAFTRNGTKNVWSRTQILDGEVSGTRFFVTFTVGAEVRWELVIKDASDKVLYINQNTTVFHTGDIRWHLP